MLSVCYSIDLLVSLYFVIVLLLVICDVVCSLCDLLGFGQGHEKRNVSSWKHFPLRGRREVSGCSVEAM